ncbi:MAG: M20/M25/M40 family metallo-hydrolase [Candidatus Acidiferrales bacterium]
MKSETEIRASRGLQTGPRDRPSSGGALGDDARRGVAHPCGAAQTGRDTVRFLAILAFVFSLFCLRPAAAQTTPEPKVPGDLTSDLKDFVETPSVSGYENQLSEKIRVKLAAFHPVTDNLGDVVVTIGGGAPHRLIVAPIDEPGFVVSGITDDGYLRLQRLPQRGNLPLIFNELHSAQPVRIRTAGNQWIDGVVAGESVHLQRNGSLRPTPDARDLENVYVDIGARSAAEARQAGVDILSPVAINRRLISLANGRIAGASVGDKFGAAALVDLLRSGDVGQVKGTLTVAFVTQQRLGGRGLDRILTTNKADEMIYVGEMLRGGNVPAMEGVHHAPRREPGSGVLIGLDTSTGELSGLAAELKQIADANNIPLASDYSAALIAPADPPPPAFPAKWVHLGIATAWPDTPAQTVDFSDAAKVLDLVADYLSMPRKSSAISVAPRSEIDSFAYVHKSTRPSTDSLLEALVETYGASNHEDRVLDRVKELLPPWTKVESGDNRNLILHLGSAPPGNPSPSIVVIAHTDEIGFAVKSISKDGRLEVETLGGMDLSFYEGHPVLVHTAGGDRPGIMELPRGWDEQNFKWPTESEQTIRVDVGARNPDDVAKLGIHAGADWVTIPKKYRPLLGTRANGRSFDDRVGDTALISAVWALGGPLKGRDITFVWSTGEELGLVGAGALAARLAAQGHPPDYVFAVDTLVSSDSPLESKRFGDAEIGKGFAIRAVDNSNVAPRDLVAKVEKLARANQIPYQLGVTGGGNDGAQFVPFGSVDIALGWPLRYSHSPAEVIDTRDVDSLARIIAVIARGW